MAHNFKVPPKLGDENIHQYSTWKNEIKIWQLVTDLTKSKQALAIVLCLSGKPKQVALELKTEDLNKENGTETLLTALDTVYKKGEKERAYEAYSNFENIERTVDMSIGDYIILFERQYNKCKGFNMKLPDEVLSFKLLDKAMLSSKEKQLALAATSDLSYDVMKSSLKRIFADAVPGENTFSSMADSAISVKQESVFYAKPREPWSKAYVKQQKGTNPLNRFGKRTRCAICQSIFHWAKDCPEKTKNVLLTEDDEQQQDSQGDEEEDDVCVVNFIKNNEINSIFLTESVGCALIDTACTKTVCGQRWFADYINILNTNKIKYIGDITSHTSFKFGDSEAIYSKFKAILPIVIGKVKCKILTDVVDANIPLLLSKESLKRANTILNLNTDKAQMFRQPIQLLKSDSGHYYIDIISGMVGNKRRENICYLNRSLENIKDLEKLHKQFGHASAYRLEQLIKDSGGKCDKNFSDLIKQVVNNCNVCFKFKKPPAKPVVSLPMSKEFNDIVSVDLHQLGPKLWYLHIMDLFTKFSAACIVKSKKSEVFVAKFIRHWIAIHGAPKKLFSDNGGEFCNADVVDMAENFNIELKNTAAYSPFSNGAIERHNQTLTNILTKLKHENEKLDNKILLSWAIYAKNSLGNIDGFSSYQLVYGKNPNLPSNLVNDLPALEGLTKSELIANHISTLHAAKKAFMEAECSKKIRLALKKQTRNFDSHFQHGDKVFYKRPSSKQWSGPAVVIGLDSSVVFLKHGNNVIKVHKCFLQHVQKNFNHIKPTDDIVTEESKVDQHSIDDAEMFSDSESILDDNEIESSQQQQTQDKEVVNLEPGSTGIEATISLANPTPEFGADNISPASNPAIATPRITYKSGQNISFINNNILHTANILGRAGKSTGKYKNWYNIIYTSPESVVGEKECINTAQLEIKMTELNSEDKSKSSNEENIYVVEDNTFIAAKQKELQSWIQNQVYTAVPDDGQKAVSTRWICTLKEVDKELVPKARLVARGFEDPHRDFIAKDSPTCSTEALRLVLAIISNERWMPHSIDVKTAFLQGSEMSRKVYVKPPREANCSEKLWLLQKCVYGLSDASLAWYKRVKEVMIQCGGQMSCIEPTVFFWKNQETKLYGIIACHVDDFIWGGNQDFEATIIDKIRNIFKIGKEESHMFTYLGIELANKQNGIQLHQRNYINNINPVLTNNLPTDKQVPLNPQQVKVLQEKIGQILWIGRQTRPDILFDACQLANNVKNAKVKDLIQANKIIGKAKAQQFSINIQQLDNKENLKLIVMADASLGNLPDGGSQGGHLIMLLDSSGKISPITWKSKRIRRVARSTLAAETLSLSDALDTGMFIRTLYQELTGRVIQIISVTDNKSLVDTISSTKLISEKRLRMEISCIKEMIETKSVEKLLWVDSSKQLADCLTKNGASSHMLINILNKGHWEL